MNHFKEKWIFSPVILTYCYSILPLINFKVLLSYTKKGTFFSEGNYYLGKFEVV